MQMNKQAHRLPTHQLLYSNLWWHPQFWNISVFQNDAIAYQIMLKRHMYCRNFILS